MLDTNWKCEKENDEPDASCDNTCDKVEILNNKIYFYGEVNRINNLNLNKNIVALGNKYSNVYNILDIKKENWPPINIHINSYGGRVFAGFSSVDYIINSKVPITSIIDGCAASAATIMSVVAAHRLMHANSFMLIHQLSSSLWGTYENLKDGQKNNDMLMQKIKQIYIENTKIPKRKLNEILKHDLWWDAKTCLEYGLIDEII